MIITGPPRYDFRPSPCGASGSPITLAARKPSPAEPAARHCLSSPSLGGCRHEVPDHGRAPMVRRLFLKIPCQPGCGVVLRLACVVAVAVAAVSIGVEPAGAVDFSLPFFGLKPKPRPQATDPFPDGPSTEIWISSEDPAPTADREPGAVAKAPAAKQRPSPVSRRPATPPLHWLPQPVATPDRHPNMLVAPAAVRSGARMALAPVASRPSAARRKPLPVSLARRLRQPSMASSLSVQPRFSRPAAPATVHWPEGPGAAGRKMVATRTTVGRGAADPAAAANRRSQPAPGDLRSATSGSVGRPATTVGRPATTVGRPATTVGRPATTKGNPLKLRWPTISFKPRFPKLDF